ncbi:hypothetical protein D5086_008659 [Populus alba]|uniref:Uncharacterized protein n=1 Tax=Populus alba TaxID=43335 RepID=A0ACC4CHC7_POPAL
MIVVSSSSDDYDNNMSLIVDQEEAPYAHVLTHDDASSSVMPQCRGRVPSQRDPFTCKYKVSKHPEWKP